MRPKTGKLGFSHPKITKFLKQVRSGSWGFHEFIQLKGGEPVGPPQKGDWYKWILPKVGCLIRGIIIVISG